MLTQPRAARCRGGSGREQHVRDPIELDLDCGLLIFEDGEWRLRELFTSVPSKICCSDEAVSRLTNAIRAPADGGDVGAKGGEANAKDIQELRRDKKRLEEENNMLKYKMEVLIGAPRSLDALASGSSDCRACHA